MQQVYEKIRYLVRVNARVNRHPGKRLSDWAEEQLLQLAAGELLELAKADALWSENGTSSDYGNAVEDELADVLNFLLQYAVRRGIKYGRIVVAMTEKLDERLSV